MSDDSLQALRREWLTTRSIASETRYLAERVRVGDLRRERVEVAALLAYPAAQAAVGPVVVLTPEAALCAPVTYDERMYVLLVHGFFDDRIEAQGFLHTVTQHFFRICSHLVSIKIPKLLASALEAVLSYTGSEGSTEGGDFGEARSQLASWHASVSNASADPLWNLVTAVLYLLDVRSGNTNQWRLIWSTGLTAVIFATPFVVHTDTQIGHRLLAAAAEDGFSEASAAPDADHFQTVRRSFEFLMLKRLHEEYVPRLLQYRLM